MMPPGPHQGEGCYYQVYPNVPLSMVWMVKQTPYLPSHRVSRPTQLPAGSWSYGPVNQVCQLAVSPVTTTMVAPWACVQPAQTYEVVDRSQVEVIESTAAQRVNPPHSLQQKLCNKVSVQLESLLHTWREVFNDSNHAKSTLILSQSALNLLHNNTLNRNGNLACAIEYWAWLCPLCSSPETKAVIAQIRRFEQHRIVTIQEGHGCSVNLQQLLKVVNQVARFVWPDRLPSKITSQLYNIQLLSSQFT